MLFYGCSDGITTPPVEEENKVIEVTDETWDKEVLQVEFAMVDFYSDSCPPCKKLEPIVKELAKENSKLKVCKLDVTKNKKTTSMYKIWGLPTLIFFKEGKEVDRIVGLKTKAYIQSKIDSLMGEKEEERKEKKDKKVEGCNNGICLPPPGY